MTNYSTIGRKAFLKILLTILFSCFVTGTIAWGHGAGGDIALFSTNGQVDVGFAILDEDDDQQVFFSPNENVFSLVLLPLTPNPVIPWQFGSSEPGFDADDSSLPPEADIVYNLQELSFWDGQQNGSVQFSPATGINGGVAPNPEKSFASGGFHSHPLFGVTDPSGTAADGVYVGKLTVSVEGLTDSDPYYMVALVTESVTNLGTVDEQVAAAEAIGEMARLYADDPTRNPAPIYGGVDFTFFANALGEVRTQAIPEPTSIALATVLLVAVAGGNRRLR